MLNPVSFYRHAALVIEIFGCRHADLEATTATQIQQDIEVSLTKRCDVQSTDVNSTYASGAMQN